ncbi:MAG: Hsp33 family molecular chaperone HslO [Pigmentiphaga sp.]|uniref:Hsp33 family molecular chaperone HslO n=1 Tax=Pigmentiphaga sp. TaxID=1977564 RepID=UPI0029A896C9|nr:Hsp33 family molecular chaperone HslO [Pigmentiphaga sp.]MDX3905036.1 Hsp33 family molecular chaperone HslO [Pigmentiphaga sp.]
MFDQLKKYLFEDQTVRAEVVSIRDTWKEIQARHDYPPAVQRLLGELVAASTLLAANIKFKGTVVLQLQGDGPIGLIVVECHADLGLRATVKLREGRAVPDDGTFQSLLNPHGGGRFSVLLDPQDRLPGQQPYQGIVALEGDSVAQALEHYMLTSEQLQTRIWLAADSGCAAGVLLQQLPKHGGKASPETTSDTDDTWERALILADTLKAEELLSLAPDALVRRLYWQETLHAFDPATITYRCTCSREKVADVLLRLGKEEVDDILAEQGRVQINCDYCVKSFDFDPVDCAELFANASASIRHESRSQH